MTATANHTARLERMHAALKHAGLSMGQAARQLRWSKRDLAVLMANDDPDVVGPHEIVAFAQLVQVDPRWLARGIISPAAEAAVFNLKRLRAEKQGNFDRLKQAEFDRILQWMAMTPQPELAQPDWEETCRYCGCTPDRACAQGCEWADRRSTICSACLEPVEGAGP